MIHARRAGSRRPRWPAMAAAVAALTMIAAGCGSSSPSGSGAAATTAAPTADATTAAPATTAAATTTAAPATTAGSTSTSAAAGGGTAVAVTESEFKIDLAATNFTAGAYTFTTTNAGQFKHNITIEGPGVDKAKSDNVEPGKSGSVSVTLQPGTYEIYCSVPTHKDKGMDLTITVT